MREHLTIGGRARQGGARAGAEKGSWKNLYSLTGAWLVGKEGRGRKR